MREALAAHQALWRPLPFQEPAPAWSARYPHLTAALLALPDDTVDALASDDDALLGWLVRYLPELRGLPALIALPVCTATAAAPAPRLLTGIPGRKQAQIRAFAAALGAPVAELVEWCAGKGHLGRLLAWRHDVPVLSLEQDAQLVAAGVALARRAGVRQTFVVADVQAPHTAACLCGRHAVALHACGDLHLALIRAAAACRLPALDVAPCCYYRIATPRHVPLNADAGLALSRDELHLAVTECATAGARSRRRAWLALAWKLAFLEWRARQGVARQQRFGSTPEAWLGLGFAGWLQRLCRREGLPAPAADELPRLAAEGMRRQAQVRRLELVRMAFRRALELWLVLDRAVYLQRQGYQVRVTTFCARADTPRNVLISARR